MCNSTFIIKSALSLICSVGMSFQLLAADISQTQLVDKMAQTTPPLILDVRTADEFAEGHIPGAINISHTELADRLQEVKDHKNSEIILYCRSGRRAGVAEELLLLKGFTQINHLEGDFNAWSNNKLPIEQQ